MIEDGEDNNNNGDINGNSEMIDLHDRRIQEERARELQVRERNAHSVDDLVPLREELNVMSEMIPNTQSHDITAEQTNCEQVARASVEGASAINPSKSTTSSDEDKANNLKVSSIVSNQPLSSNSAIIETDNNTESRSDEETDGLLIERDHQNKNSDASKSFDDL